MNYIILLASVKRLIDEEIDEIDKEIRQEIIFEVLFELIREEVLEILISLPYLLSMKYWPSEGESTSIHDILIHQISKKLEKDIENNT